MDFVVDSGLLEYVGRLEPNQIKFLNKFSIAEAVSDYDGRAVLAWDNHSLSPQNVGFMFKKAKYRINEMKNTVGFDAEASQIFLNIKKNLLIVVVV